MEKDSILDLEDESDIIERNIGNLQEGIDSLKTEQKSCISLFYLKEKSYKEVVELTGYDIKKVKSYVQNGKRNLALYFNKINK